MIHDDERKNGYEKGWDDGWKSRDQAIVRCKDCKNGEVGAYGRGIVCHKHHEYHYETWFCPDGEKRSD